MVSEFREKLIDRMVHIYGLEDIITRGFCELCERFENNEVNDKQLLFLVECHEADPVFLNLD